MDGWPSLCSVSMIPASNLFSQFLHGAFSGCSPTVLFPLLTASSVTEFIFRQRCYISKPIKTTTDPTCGSRAG